MLLHFSAGNHLLLFNRKRRLLLFYYYIIISHAKATINCCSIWFHCNILCFQADSSLLIMALFVLNIWLHGEIWYKNPFSCVCILHIQFPFIFMIPEKRAHGILNKWYIYRLYVKTGTLLKAMQSAACRPYESSHWNRNNEKKKTKYYTHVAALRFSNN